MSEQPDNYAYYIEKIDDGSSTSMRGPYSQATAELQLKEGEKIVRRAKLSAKREDHASPFSNQVPQDYQKMLNTLRNWGIGLILFGVISLIFSEYLDPSWGVLLIIVGLSSFYFRSAAMFVVFGFILGFAAVLNILSGESSWIRSSIMQSILTVLTFIQFFRWRKVESDFIDADKEKGLDGGQRRDRSAPIFPWASCLFGSISLTLFVLFIAAWVLLFYELDELPTIMNFLEGLMFNLAILGFSAGLASLLQGYRHKIVSIFGMLAASIFLVVVFAEFLFP